MSSIEKMMANFCKAASCDSVLSMDFNRAMNGVGIDVTQSIGMDPTLAPKTAPDMRM